MAAKYNGDRNITDVEIDGRDMFWKYVLVIYYYNGSSCSFAYHRRADYCPWQRRVCPFQFVSVASWCFICIQILTQIHYQAFIGNTVQKTVKTKTRTRL